MQHDVAVSHFVPELGGHLVEVLRSLGARVVEDRRADGAERELSPPLRAPVAIFISHGYWSSMQRPSPRYRLLRWALEDAVEAAMLYPPPADPSEKPRVAIAVCCVFSDSELATFGFPPGLRRQDCTRALERAFSVLDTCSDPHDSLLLRARERLGNGWRLDLRFDELDGEWVTAGIERSAERRLVSA